MEGAGAGVNGQHNNNRFCGRIFTTIAYIPQAFKVHKTKHTRDLSIWMLGILTSGIFLWTIYGVLMRDNILIFANSISCVISGYILL